MLMANSLRSWNESYDLRLQTREAQQAVNGMQAWRNHLLSRHGVAEVAAVAGVGPNMKNEACTEGGSSSALPVVEGEGIVIDLSGSGSDSD